MRPRTTKDKKIKTVNSSAFRSGDSNFHGGQFRTDTEDNSTGHNKGLPNIAGAVIIESACNELTLVRLDSLVHLSPQHRQAPNRYVQAYWDTANIELYGFERTIFENQFDWLTALNAYASKNKFVKKPTHSTAQNTLSFFCNATNPTRKKMKECFLHRFKKFRSQNHIFDYF